MKKLLLTSTYLYWYSSFAVKNPVFYVSLLNITYYEEDTYHR